MTRPTAEDRAAARAGVPAAEAALARANGALDEATRLHGRGSTGALDAERLRNEARAHVARLRDLAAEPEPCSPHRAPQFTDQLHAALAAAPLHPLAALQQERRRIDAEVARACPPREPPFADKLTADDQDRFFHVISTLGDGWVGAAEMKDGLPLWQAYELCGVVGRTTSGIDTPAQHVDGFVLGQIAKAVRPGGRAMNMAEASKVFDQAAARTARTGWKPSRPLGSPRLTPDPEMRR